MGGLISVCLSRDTKKHAVIPTSVDNVKGSVPSSIKKEYEELPEKRKEDIFIQSFEYQTLRKSTRGFGDDHVLGEGGFGKVYKGWLNIKGSALTPVAIKRLHSECPQGHKQWLSEILALSQLRHDNLVKFYGYCSQNSENLLIYEFLSMGSLDYHLFPVDENGYSLPSNLSFRMRLKIAFDMAKGLAYLHGKKIVHRDFKTSNVLLDDHFNAKLTDFGLARAVSSGTYNASTIVMGTLGYLDPEYYDTGRVNYKSDVYAFGVMLLEMITGKHAVDKITNVSLTEWSKSYFTSKIPNMDALVDPNIVDQLQTPVALLAVTKLAITANSCVQRDPESRPSIDEVVLILEHLASRMDLKSLDSKSL